MNHLRRENLHFEYGLDQFIRVAELMGNFWISYQLCI